MSKYLFVYHGGRMEETPEAQQAEMARWTEWYGKMGKAVVDGGAPVGPSSTVASGGTSDGAENAASGYTVIEAGSMEEACKHAQGCPILRQGGNVEVAPIMEM